MPRFDEFTTQYHVYKRRGHGTFKFTAGVPFELKKGMGALETYDTVLSSFKVEIPDLWPQNSHLVPALHPLYMLGTTHRQMLIERNWYALGQPYYKVWPAMVDALMHTKIDIGVEHFEMPFPVILIRLPYHFFREDKRAPWLRGILVTRQREVFSEEVAKALGKEPGSHDRLMLFSQFEMDEFTESQRPPNAIKEEVGNNSVLSKLTLVPGHTIEDDLEQMPIQTSHHKEGGSYWPNMETTQKIVALAVGVCFIAIGKDKKLITRARPDVHDRRSQRRGRRQMPPGRGWAVGQDIKLPKLRQDAATSTGEGEGQRLQFGHVRSGHMRYQRYGSKDAPEYRLIFIHPTVVRPDLPMKPRLTPRAVRRPDPEAPDA